jgi:hypothetical protein
VTTPSEKLSTRLSIAARATPASSSRRVAADDLRDRLASLIEAQVESVGHGPYMGGEAALGRQARGEKRKRDEAERPKGPRRASPSRSARLARDKGKARRRPTPEARRSSRWDG